MAEKVLGQGGISIADILNVEGSQLEIDQIEARPINLVYELGQTIFAERLSGSIFRAATTAMDQDTNFDIITTNLPDVPTRILGIQVFTPDDPARLSHANVSMRNNDVEREIPIWVWDATNSERVRMQDNGAAVGDRFVFQPIPELRLLPNMLMGTSQPETVDDIALRGRTAGFGAGTITVVAIYYVAFAEETQSGVGSFGLPVPGW